MNNNIQIRNRESVETTRETPSTFTIEHRLNLSKSMKGRIPWNKGLTKKDLRVLKYTNSRLANPNYKENLSRALTGHKSTFNRKHTPIEIAKISTSHLGKKHEYAVWNKGLTIATSKKLRQIGKNISLSLKSNLTFEERSKLGRHARSKARFTRESKGERNIALKLKEHGIKFISQYKIQTDKILTYVDIFIPDKICIYIDGIYWHNRPETKKRDIILNKELKKLGYLVKRYTLNRNEDDVVKRILDDDIVRHSK